jgi:3-methyladenine DNA glycosylase/8-oxoguanine DNA glycosylase
LKRTPRLVLEETPSRSVVVDNIDDALVFLRRTDPLLGHHIDKVGGYGLVVLPPTSLVEGLAEAIVAQQLSTKAAATIAAKLRRLGAHGFPTSTELLALDESSLRGVGLSSQKVRAVKEIARRDAEGELLTLEQCATLGDEEIVARFTALPGVGPWTVHMLLMFRLGRLDVLPVRDYGIQKGFQRVFRTPELPRPPQVQARGERWRPFRTVASWYLWRALDPPATSLERKR